MDKKTIETYDKLAKEYDDETVDFWQKFPRTFFDKFAETAQGKILDVGSGPGRDGLLLQEKGLKVTCLDASEAMIILCRQRGLQSVLADFTSMPFEDKTFDGAWAYTSLLHVPKADLPKALNEIKRVIKDDGVLGLGMIEGETEEYRESSGINMPRLFSFYTAKEITEALDNNGFEVIHFEQFKPRTKNYLNFIARKR